MSTDAPALASAEKRARVVQLRLAGWEYDDIAAEVGLAGRSGAHYHVTEWLKSLPPSSELAEEYRHTQLARSEERYRRFRDLAYGDRDEQTGEWTRLPDWQAVQAIQRDGERMARMLGADLEKGASAPVVFTREIVAKFFYAYHQDGATVEEATQKALASRPGQSHARPAE